MINSKIMEILEPLNIPIYWIEYNGEESQYIIFQTLNQDNTYHYDDVAHSEGIEISLNYWFKDDVDTDIIEENLNKIKLLLKENNFIKISEMDLKQDNYYGRSFKFKFLKDFI